MGTIQIDGSTPKLTIGNATAEDATILFDGNAQDFYIALDDSADDLLIGLGSTVGTTPIIAIDENKLSTFSGAITVGVDNTGHDVKLFGATAGSYWLWDESADGVVQVGTLTVGVDDAGHDVKLFGNAAGAYFEWDASADELRIMGASADATTSTGKLLLATSLTDINANDVIGKIDFQAPHEAGGTDAITVAASIRAIAQATFTSSVNATDLIFYTGHSEAAAEKIRFTSQNEIGIAGANYGTDGQVLTSAGAGAAVAWEDAAGFDVSSITGATALTVQPAAADEIVLSDAGTLKRLDIKHIQNTPAFYVHLSSSQSISNNSLTRLDFDVEALDSDGAFASSVFTPTVAGYYYFTACAYLTGIDDNEFLKLYIRRNGSHANRPRVADDHDIYHSTRIFSTGTNNAQQIQASGLIYSDTNDYFDVAVKQDSGDSQDADGENCWFAGFRVTGLEAI